MKTGNDKRGADSNVLKASRFSFYFGAVALTRGTLG
jgi:hypothetical protein